MTYYISESSDPDASRRTFIAFVQLPDRGQYRINTSARKRTRQLAGAATKLQQVGNILTTMTGGIGEVQHDRKQYSVTGTWRRKSAP
jgi:hypothetical protein